MSIKLSSQPSYNLSNIPSLQTSDSLITKPSYMLTAVLYSTPSISPNLHLYFLPSSQLSYIPSFQLSLGPFTILIVEPSI